MKFNVIIIIVIIFFIFFLFNTDDIIEGYDGYVIDARNLGKCMTRCSQLTDCRSLVWTKDNRCCLSRSIRNATNNGDLSYRKIGSEGRANETYMGPNREIIHNYDKVNYIPVTPITDYYYDIEKIWSRPCLTDHPFNDRYKYATRSSWSTYGFYDDLEYSFRDKLNGLIDNKTIAKQLNHKNINEIIKDKLRNKRNCKTLS